MFRRVLGFVFALACLSFNAAEAAAVDTLDCHSATGPLQKFLAAAAAPTCTESSFGTATYEAVTAFLAAGALADLAPDLPGWAYSAAPSLRQAVFCETGSVQLTSDTATYEAVTAFLSAGALIKVGSKGIQCRDTTKLMAI